MPTTAAQQLSAIERKLQNRNGVTVKRAKSFSSSAPTSPSTFRRKKAPALEPRYTKSTYLLIEARKLAKELEEKKKKGNLFPKSQNIKGSDVSDDVTGPRSRSGSGSSIGKRFRRPNTSADSSRSSSPDDEGNEQTGERTFLATKATSRRRVKSIYGRPPASDPPEAVVVDGRLTPLRSSGRRKNFMLPGPTKTCQECEKPLTSGFYSEHLGLPYCNVPCYTNLFSSLYNRPEDFDSCCSLSEEQKNLRGKLIPKLRTYNTYYINKPCQISCREINDKFIIEGVLKVYWGLIHPVTLADSCYHYQHFQIPKRTSIDQNEDNNKENTEYQSINGFAINGKSGRKHSATNVVATVLKRPKTATRYNVKGKPVKEDLRKRTGCYACNYHQHHGENSTSFIPPKGCPTTLRLTNHVTAPVVIDMLLKKFQIKDDRKRFSLFTVYESGGQKRLQNDSYPLLTRLSLGPCEDVAKIYIMDAADQMDIPLEVAQYINFNSQVLETFVKKFYEEEDREVERIKEKYADYRQLLVKRMVELAPKASRVTII